MDKIWKYLSYIQYAQAMQYYIDGLPDMAYVQYMMLRMLWNDYWELLHVSYSIMVSSLDLTVRSI